MKQNALRNYIAVLLALTACLPAFTESWTGKVVGITDGDTIKVMRDGQEVKVRLHGIDSPEEGQAYGSAAKQTASRFAHGKTVSVEVKDTDRYGRIVGLVTLPDGESLSLQMVREGMAWHYVKYAPDDMPLAWAESIAKDAKRGLWADPNPLPPWEFRSNPPAPEPVQAPVQTQQQTQTRQQPQTTQQQTQQTTVYATNTGKKYHRGNCRHLSKSKIPVTLQQAKSRGLTPCSVCRP